MTNMFDAALQLASNRRKLPDMPRLPDINRLRMEYQASIIRYINAWNEQTLGDPELHRNMESFDKECDRLEEELRKAEKEYDSFLSGQAEAQDECE